MHVAYNWGKGVVKGFFWGRLIGLMSPASSLPLEEIGGTWKEIGKSADRLYDKIKEEIGQAQKIMEELANREKDS